MKNKSYTHGAKLIRVGNTTVAIPKVNLCWNDIFEEVKICSQKQKQNYFLHKCAALDVFFN